MGLGYNIHVDVSVTLDLTDAHVEGGGREYIVHVA